MQAEIRIAVHFQERPSRQIFIWNPFTCFHGQKTCCKVWHLITQLLLLDRYKIVINSLGYIYGRFSARKLIESEYFSRWNVRGGHSLHIMYKFLNFVLRNHNNIGLACISLAVSGWISATCFPGIKAYVNTGERRICFGLTGRTQLGRNTCVCTERQIPRDGSSELEKWLYSFTPRKIIFQQTNRWLMKFLQIYDWGSSDFCSGGVGFESWPGYRVYRLRFCVAFHRPVRQMFRL
jgi:hypothetical protein